VILNEVKIHIVTLLAVTPYSLTGNYKRLSVTCLEEHTSGRCYEPAKSCPSFPVICRYGPFYWYSTYAYAYHVIPFFHVVRPELLIYFCTLLCEMIVTWNFCTPRSTSMMQNLRQ
jgi:hypothetical protein